MSLLYFLTWTFQVFRSKTSPNRNRCFGGVRSGIAGRFPFPGGVVQASATKLDVARAAARGVRRGPERFSGQHRLHPDAFDAAALHASQGTKLGRVWQHEVRFPSGDYKISDTIIIRSVSPNVTHGICAGGHAGRPLNDTTWCMISALRVTGVGMATVEQTSPGRDVFAGAAVYRLEFQYILKTS